MNWLQVNGRGRLDDEEQALAEYFGEGRYATFCGKHMARGKVPLERGDFVAGDIGSVMAALRRLGVTYTYDDYPPPLRGWLHRKIWTARLGDVRRELIAEGEVAPMFVKPKGRLKRFPGFVLSGLDGLWLFGGAGNGTELWCSEPVAWKSEYRCPVIGGTVQGMFPAPGSGGLQEDRPDMGEVQRMADAFTGSPAAYCIDAGVLPDGTTALVEVNDAFSLGRYGMPPELYGRLLTARWAELTQ